MNTTRGDELARRSANVSQIKVAKDGKFNGAPEVSTGLAAAVNRRFRAEGLKTIGIATRLLHAAIRSESLRVYWIILNSGFTAGG